MNLAQTSPEEWAGARPVAQHCAELVPNGPQPEERSEDLRSWRRELGLELAGELEQLFSGGKLQVSVSKAEMLEGHEVFEKIGPVAVNCLLRCGPRGQTALLSLDCGTAIALTDCSFGGEGQIPDQIPSNLPRSAAMLVEQFAGTTAQVITQINGTAERKWGDVLVRSESVTRLKPFETTAQIALFKLSLDKDGLSQWEAWIAIVASQLDDLLPGIDAQGSSAPRIDGPSDPMTGPFSAMPVRLEAILGTFDVTLAQLDRLRPGDMIPLEVARDLPLMIDNKLLAHGQIGNVDNRLALRVTRLERSV